METYEPQSSGLEQSGTAGKGIRKQVDFNEYGQPIGTYSSSLSTLIGQVARTHCPPTYMTWHDVPKNVKDKIWNTILDEYDIEIQHKVIVLSKANGCWKQWKHELRKKYDEYETDAEREKHPPKCVKLEDWKTFIRICSTKEYAARREKGRSSREKMISPHTTGRRGAAKMAEELKMQNPTGIVTRTELFIASHTKKDGTCPSQFMVEKLDEIRKMVDDNSVEGEAILDNDPVAHVFGRDRRGYVRGMGRGISKTTFSSSAPSREIASREKRARESVESNYESIMRRLDEESKARKVLEEKFNALPRCDSSHGTRMTRSSDQLSSSYQGMRQSSVHLDSPIEQLSSLCILKNFKNKNVAMGRVDRNASQSNLSYTIIVDDIYDITAELYARDGTLGDITPGDIITWPKSLVHFS